MLLPMQFFKILAQRWNWLIKNGCDVLEIWLHIRITLIPKPVDDTGARRPSGIASAFWRISGSCMLNNVEPWVGSWIHADVYGAVKGVDANELHERVNEKLQDALEHRLRLCGGKIDLSKFFDRVNVELAMRLLMRFGLDPAVAK